MNNQGNQDNPWRTVGVVSAIGFELVLCMGLGYFLGTAAQGWFGGNPLWVVAGILLGMVVGILGVYFMLRYYMVNKHE